MNREVVKMFRAVLSERRRPPSEWPLALVAVGVGGCAVGSQFGVPRAHRDDAVPDDDGTTSRDGNVGACRGRRRRVDCGGARRVV